MGKLIEQLAPEYGFTIHARLDVNDDLGQAAGADVAIEFSTPHAALGNIEILAALGIPTVVGTTGWLEHMDRVRTAIGKGGAGLVWAANFSIGVNVFLRAVHETARL
ncbi:MAG: dihydrodipicolinate reductase C-terminal domain-containing protein, partial [Bryobacteraceae bacterium]